MTGFPGFLGERFAARILRRTGGTATCLVPSRFV